MDINRFLGALQFTQKTTLAIPTLSIKSEPLGVIVISISGKPDGSIEIYYMSAAIAVLIAAIMGACYTIAGKKLLESYSAISLTMYAMIFGSLGLIPFLNISFFEEVTKLSITGWLAVLFLSVCSTVIGYVFWFVALEIKDASKLSAYLYFIPVLSTIISFILFNEKITIFFIIGGVLVIIGLYIVNKHRNKIPN